MNELTGGTLQIGANIDISGVTIDPQGTAAAAITSPTATMNGAGQQTFDFGTASGECDILCAADYELTTGASVTINIYSNGLPNLFGGDANFRSLRAIFFQVLSGGDSVGVVIGGAASDPHPLFFGADDQTWTIFPDGSPLTNSCAAGVPVTVGAENIKILNAGAVTVIVRVALGGTSV